MVSLGSWCQAGPHCPSMLTVITHGVSRHVEGLGARTMERPLRTPPGSAQDASSQCPARPLTQRDQTPRKGAMWGLPESSPDHQQSSLFLSRQPVVLGQEEVRLRAPMGPMQGRLGVCGD